MSPSAFYELWISFTDSCRQLCLRENDPCYRTPGHNQRLVKFWNSSKHIPIPQPTTGVGHFERSPCTVALLTSVCQDSQQDESRQVIIFAHYNSLLIDYLPDKTKSLTQPYAHSLETGINLVKMARWLEIWTMTYH